MRAARQVLLDLADRCEREEGSRELDCRIQAALDPMAAERIRHPSATFNYTGIHTEEPGCVWNYAVPPYTTSLDAAVTLVPRARAPYVEILIKPDGADVSLFGAVREICGWAKTPALALCAASLRARAEAL